MTHMTSDSLFSFRRLAISLFMLLTMSGVSLLAHANGSSAPSGTITEWNATFADNAGPKGSIQALAMWDDGSGEALYAGASNTSSSGPFTAAGGIAMGYIGRWNGTSWSPLGTGLDGPVSQIVPFGDELIVSGQFQTAGGLIVNGIASWNGQRWRRFGNQPSPAALAIFQGALVGALPAQNPVGSSVYVVVRWNGVSWDELGPGMEQPISALVDFNGVLVAGGNFSTAGGVQARFIAQWTGSQWLPIGNGLNGWVTSLTVHQGQLVAGSRYGLMVGQNSIARWDGNAWTSPGTLQGRAYTLAVWNGDLIVGGNNPNGYLMRWSGANWDPMAGNTDGPIQTLSLMPASSMPAAISGSPARPRSVPCKLGRFVLGTNGQWNQRSRIDQHDPGLRSSGRRQFSQCGGFLPTMLPAGLVASGRRWVTVSLGGSSNWLSIRANW